MTALIDVSKNNMALNLNIPALQENPLFLAETRPQKIRQIIAELDSTDALDIALHLNSELEILNRQKVSSSNRVQALDCYREFATAVTNILEKEYCNAALPLHDQAKLAASSVESLWLELGYGYKLALIDLQNQLIKLGADKSSAEAIQSAMHAIAEQLMVHYQTYVIPPEYIWSDLNQLYFCAVQLKVQHLIIKDAPSNGSGETVIKSAATIENTYKHTMLMSLAEPQHLAQGDIRLVADYLSHHIGQAQIASAAPLENDTATFIIGLNSNNPPVPYSKKSDTPNPVTDILLQTIDLVRAIHQDLGQLQNHKLPDNGSIPVHARVSDYIDLLTYLIRNWGITPKRIFNRTLKDSDIELVFGMAAIQRISGECGATNPSLQNTSDAGAPATPSRWKTLNISATGISLRRHHTAEKNIRVGGLVGIKAKEESYWSIGIVRWANCGTRDRLDIGIQLLAPQAQCAIANINDTNRNEPVLVLAEIIAVRQAASIIAPKGTYSPARQLTLRYSDKTQQIMLTKVTERTHFIERIQFSNIG